MHSDDAAPTVQVSDPTDHGGYRSWLVTPEPAGWLGGAIDQVAAWLRFKSIDVDLARDGALREADRTILVRHHTKDGESAFRLVIDEDNDGGHWTTAVTFVEGDDLGWVAVTSLNDRRRIVPVPGIVRYLLETVDLRDGYRRMRPEPWLVTSESDREDLLDLLTSQRRGAVFVAGSDDLATLTAFQSRVSAWTRWATGLAHVAVLDPGSALWLADQADGLLAVGPGTVRTFRPGIDPAVPSTLRGSRTLGREQLSSSDDRRLLRLFGLFARSILDERPEPSRVAVWRRTFGRLDSRDASAQLLAPTPAAQPLPVVAAPVPSAPVPSAPPLSVEPQRVPAPLEVVFTERPVGVDLELTRAIADGQQACAETEAVRADLERVRVALGVGDLAPATLSALAAAARAPRLDPTARNAAAARIAALQRETESLDDQLIAAKAAEWAAREDAVDQRDELDRMDRRNRALASVLAAHGISETWTQIDEVPIEGPDAPPQPGSWQDLVDHLKEWEAHGVVITADVARMLELDELDVDGRVLDSTWRGLRALAGYVRAKRAGVCAGGFAKYLDDQPAGYPRIAPKSYVPTETKQTMDRFARERTFTVPTLWEPSGMAVMQQHLRLGRIPNKDPRAYLEDYTSKGGPVVVGYVGTHLPNMQTRKLN